MTDGNRKCGIVITYHNHASDFVIPCLDSILKHTPDPKFVLVFDNESANVEAIKLPERYRHPNIEFIRVDDQLKNGGLTGTWNQGIRKCFEMGCSKVVLLNDDTLVDESWPVFIESIKEDDCIYGPASNNPGCNALHQKSNKEESMGCKGLISEEVSLNGFCLGFSKKCLESNLYKENLYFNPAYPFGGNEVEWEKRFEKKGGRFKFVQGCFVFHHKENAWKKIKLLRGQKDHYGFKYLKKKRLNILKSRLRRIFQFDYLVGILGKNIKMVSPSLYSRLKPYFPSKDPRA